MTEENTLCVTDTARLTIFLRRERREGGIKILHEDVCR